MSWQKRLIQQIVADRNSDGGWGYRPDATTCAEPTALSCLALGSHNPTSHVYRTGLSALMRLQQPDGSVSVADGVTGPSWTTALALLAWTRASLAPTDPLAGAAAKAIDWLTRTFGKRLPLRPDVFGHDTTLQGWPWVADTHSWAEPTAYAVMALRAAGQSDHPRTREGVRLLLDRSLPEGGWNYGNTRVYDAVLRPFPATTGIVLTALAGVPHDPKITRSISYLEAALIGVRAPLTLSWGVIGLTAWGARPKDASTMLSTGAKRMRAPTSDVMSSALLLLANDPTPLLTEEPVRATHD